MNILKFLFCSFVTGSILYTEYIFSYQEPTLQLKFYFWGLVILAISSWIIMFSKRKIEIKLALIITVILFNFSEHIIPDVKYAYDYETCLDMSVCAEGLEVKTPHGKIKINEETCLQYDYSWDHIRKTCTIE